MVGDRRSTPTWQWIAVTAVGIIITVAGYAYTATQKRIEACENDLRVKVDQREVLEMKQDLRDIKAMMTSHIIETGSGRVARRQ